MSNFQKITINTTSGKKLDVQIEKGITFENNGAKYTVGNDGKLIIESKDGKAHKSLTMTDYQVSVFRAIADNVKEEGTKMITLSKADLQEAFKQFAAGEFKKDLHKEINENDYMLDRFDKNSANQTVSFNVQSKTNKTVGGRLTFGIVSDNQKTTKKSDTTSAPKTKKTDSTTSTNKSENVVLKHGKMEINNKIEPEWEEYIADTAKKAGVSEDFIRFMISVEGFDKKAKKHGNEKFPTVGFGHTTNATSNRNFPVGYEIPIHEAFDWLAQDIIDCRNQARIHFKEFDKLPQSMQEGVIDTIYNRGQGAASGAKSAPGLKANINAGPDNYPAAAYSLCQNRNFDKSLDPGLYKRSVYRFMHAIQDLSPEQQAAAIRRLKKQGYYDKACNELSTADSLMMQRDFERMTN